MTTGRRAGRKNVHCPRCGALLAGAHRDMLILRRLTINWPVAVRAERTGDEIHITCQCGAVRIIAWATFQV